MKFFSIPCSPANMLFFCNGQRLGIISFTKKMFFVGGGVELSWHSIWSLQWEGMFWDMSFFSYDYGHGMKKKQPLISLFLCHCAATEHWKKNYITGAYYQLNAQAVLSWAEADESCKQQGATLVSITNPNEQAFISGERYPHTLIPL